MHMTREVIICCKIYLFKTEFIIKVFRYLVSRSFRGDMDGFWEKCVKIDEC